MEYASSSKAIAAYKFSARIYGYQFCQETLDNTFKYDEKVNNELHLKLYKLMTYLELNEIRCLQKKFVNDQDLEEKHKIRFLKLTKTEIRKANKMKKEREKKRKKTDEKKEQKNKQLQIVDSKKIESKLGLHYLKIKAKLGVDWETLTPKRKRRYNHLIKPTKTYRYKKILKKYFKFLNNNL
jgi:hypothetical protein